MKKDHLALRVLVAVIGLMISGVGAVSYTHLDVYKRQVQQMQHSRKQF